MLLRFALVKSFVADLVTDPSRISLPAPMYFVMALHGEIDLVLKGVKKHTRTPGVVERDRHTACMCRSYDGGTSCISIVIEPGLSHQMRRVLSLCICLLRLGPLEWQVVFHFTP